MTGEELKRELQRAGMGHIQAAAKVFEVNPVKLRDWIADREPIPEEVAEKAKHLPDRKRRSPS